MWASIYRAVALIFTFRAGVLLLEAFEQNEHYIRQVSTRVERRIQNRFCDFWSDASYLVRVLCIVTCFVSIGILCTALACAYCAAIYRIYRLAKIWVVFYSVINDVVFKKYWILLF